MSRETLATLNAETLIGYTAKRGTAWHYRADLQGAEPNHYPGPIPVEDVRRRLFGWTPVRADIRAEAITPDGVLSVADPTRVAIVRPDNGTVLGVFKSGYQVHDYADWLVTYVERILDADLAIGSAGLLRGGAVAWVQVELADTMEAAGVQFRPFLTAATSLDGSLATTYATGAQVVVCDNTLSLALTDARRREVKVRHSRHSLGRIGDVREALQIVHEAGDRFAAQVEQLTAEVVTEARWARFLDAYANTEVDSKRAATLAAERRDKLARLWNYDERVAPYAGTAWGVVQAVNTYAHHEAQVRGASRATRNTERTVTGEWDKIDRRTLDVLATV